MTGTENSMQMVRVNLKTPAGSGRREGYWRHITAVAPGAKNGYGLTGEFIKSGWREFPPGSVLLRVTPCGSVRNGWSGADVHIVGPDGLKEYAPKGTYFEMHREFLLLRDALQAALAEPPVLPAAVRADADTHDALCDTDALHDERDRVVARLEEMEEERAALITRKAELDAEIAARSVPAIEEGEE